MAGFLDDLMNEKAGSQASSPAPAEVRAPAAKASGGGGFIDSLLGDEAPPAPVSSVPSAPSSLEADSGILDTVGKVGKTLLLGQQYTDAETGQLPVYGKVDTTGYKLNEGRGSNFALRAVVGGLKKNEDKFRRLEESYGKGNVMLDPADSGNFIIADPATGELFRNNAKVSYGKSAGVMDFLKNRGLDMVGDIASIAPEIVGGITGAVAGTAGLAASPVGAIAAGAAGSVAGENAANAGIQYLDALVNGRSKTFDTRSGGEVVTDLGREGAFGTAAGFAFPLARMAGRGFKGFYDDIRTPMADYTKTAKGWMFGADDVFKNRNMGEYLGSALEQEQAAGKLAGFSPVELAGLPEKRVLKAVGNSPHDQSILNSLDESARVTQNWYDDTLDGMAGAEGRLNPTAVQQKLSADTLALKSATDADAAGLDAGLRRSVEGLPIDATGIRADLKGITKTNDNAIRSDAGISSVDEVRRIAGQDAFADVNLLRAAKDNPLLQGLTTEELTSLSRSLTEAARRGEKIDEGLITALSPLAQREPAFVSNGQLTPMFFDSIGDILARSSRQSVPGEEIAGSIMRLSTGPQSPTVASGIDVLSDALKAQTGIDARASVLAPIDANAARLSAIDKALPGADNVKAQVDNLTTGGTLRTRMANITDTYDPTPILQRAGVDVMDPSVARSAQVVGAGGGAADADITKQMTVLALKNTGGDLPAKTFIEGAKEGPSVANAISEILSARAAPRTTGPDPMPWRGRVTPEGPFGATSGDIAVDTAREQAEVMAQRMAEQRAQKAAFKQRYDAEKKLADVVTGVADDITEKNAPWLAFKPEPAPWRVPEMPRAPQPTPPPAPVFVPPKLPAPTTPFTPVDPFARLRSPVAYPAPPPKVAPQPPRVADPMAELQSRLTPTRVLADNPIPTPTPATAPIGLIDQLPLNRSLAVVPQPIVPPTVTRSSFDEGVPDLVRARLAGTGDEIIQTSVTPQMQRLEALTRAQGQTQAFRDTSAGAMGANNAAVGMLGDVAQGKIGRALSNVLLRRLIGTKGLGETAGDRMSRAVRVGDSQRARQVLRGTDGLEGRISGMEMMTRRGAEAARANNVLTPLDTIARSGIGSGLERGAEAVLNERIRSLGTGNQAVQRKAPL